MDEPELRKDPRYPVALRVRVEIGGAQLESTTRTISLQGMGVPLSEPVELEHSYTMSISLPDQRLVRGRAIAKSANEGVVGFALEVDENDRETWRNFISQESQTGSLWRMIGRFARSRGDEKEAVRSVLEEGALGVLFKRVPLGMKSKSDQVALRFHMVGENGEAYRVCFERLPSHVANESALKNLRGVEQLAPLILRVLDDALTVRFADDRPAVEITVVELMRGGFAHVQGGEDRAAGLVSLCVGELILIDVDGERVHPGFTDDELERIACDTFRMDSEAMFASPEKKARRAAAKGDRQAQGYRHISAEGEPVTAGLESLRRAQFASETKESRRYGERDIELFPEVWARVRVGASELMGPTMCDGDRVLLLALVGPGAPRVLKLTEGTPVELLAGRAGAGL